MNILGINAYHGNASAAIVCDGQLIAAVEEERFNRVKYAAGFPAQAIRYCVKEAGLKLEEIDHVAVPRNRCARLGTKLCYAVRMPSFARGRAKVLAKFIGVREALAAAFDADPKTSAAEFHRIEHHQAHGASAVFVSPFERAGLLSADGLGDFASTMWGSGSGSRMDIADAIAFPHSLGLYYTAVTQYLGFLKFGDEYKVMGLAAYGEPERLETVRDIVRFDANGDSSGFRLGLDYFVHHRTGPLMSWAEADKTTTLGKPGSFVMNHAYWGPGFSAAEMRAAIEARGIARDGWRVTELPVQELTQRAAAMIAEGKILGWFQGRAEWGPRALGNRSIVADPRRAGMKDILNRRLKHRGRFLPFVAPLFGEAAGGGV